MSQPAAACYPVVDLKSIPVPLHETEYLRLNALRISLEVWMKIMVPISTVRFVDPAQEMCECEVNE